MTLGNPIEAYRDGTITIKSLLAEIDRAFAENNPLQQQAMLATIRRADIAGALSVDDLRRITDRIESAIASTQFKPANVDDRTQSMEACSRQVGVGTILKDRFELQELIGVGGMGVVYKALDRRKLEAQDRNPYVAIKVLTDQFRQDPTLLRALQREAQKAQTLAHPNIITVYDFDRDGDAVFMSMEYLSGTPLDQLMKQPGGIALTEALRIIGKIGQALAHAHENGIIHLDLKPSNVFLTSKGKVKVIDFGIARAMPRSDGQGDLTVFDPKTLGALTPSHASAEMLEGREADPRDDIFALACITYELLCGGEHPFHGILATAARDHGVKPRRPKMLSARQWAGLRRGLSFSREERTPTVAEFVADLAPRKSTRALVIGGAGAALSAAAAVVLYLALGGTEPPTSGPQPPPAGQAGATAAKAGDAVRQPQAERQGPDLKRLADAQADEARRVEAERQAAEARRQADAQAAEARRAAAERQAAEARRQAEAERQAAETKRQAEAQSEARRAEAERQAAEAKRQAEAQAAAARRVEAEHRAAEAWRQAEIQAAEGRRVEAERQAAEAKRQAESQAAEARRVEAERQAGEAKRRQAELAVAPLDGVYFTVRSAPLLDRPNGTKLGSLPAEQRVVVTGQTTAGDWLRVTIGGSPHWVAAGDLVEQRVAEQRAWSRLGKDPTEASLIAFLKRFPDGAFADAAKQRIGGKRGEEATRVAQEDMSRALADEEAGQAKPKVAAPVSGNSASAPSAALDLLRLRTPAAEPASESPRAVPSGAGGTAAASQAMLDAGALRTDFPRGSSAELYDQAIGMIRKGNSSAAEPLLQRIIAEHPNDPLAANAKYRLAEAYFRQADYARSAIAFYDFRRSYPQHVNAPGALIGYASALGNLGRKGEACLALRQVSQEFPGASTDVKEQQNAEMRRFGC